MATWEIINDDCVAAMARMPAASIDAVVCDPPYGLEFMGKDWDRLDDRSLRARGENAVDSANRGMNDTALVKAPGFARTREAAVAAQQWHEAWAREALRVLKPGGHLLAFGGTRTYHRLACAVEDAGFEIRDSLMWLYGSGFPKSKNVALAIDKGEGYSDRGRAIPMASTHFPGEGKYSKDGEKLTSNPVGEYEARSENAERWQGWGTALKPAHEPIVMSRKPLIGTVAKNVQEHGTGGLNIDACRVGTGDNLNGGAYAENPSEPVDDAWRGGQRGASDANSYRRGGAGEYEQPSGRWPANLVLSHAEGCKQIGESQVKGYAINRFDDGAKPFGNGAGHPYSSEQMADEVVARWDCAEGCPVRVLNEQSGSAGAGGKASGPSLGKVGGWRVYGKYDGTDDAPFYDDKGGASRFFYVAKTSRKERNAGLDDFATTTSHTPMAGRGQPGLKCRKCERWKVSGNPCGCVEPEWEQSSFERPQIANNHPTVKPIELMRWLVRLVTPLDGTVLDPFVGSGTTGIAAILEGFNFIGIEREVEYVEIAKARIAYWQQNPEGPGKKKPKPESIMDDQEALF